MGHDTDATVTYERVVDLLNDIIHGDELSEDLDRMATKVADGDVDVSEGECNTCGTSKSHTGGGVYTCPRCNNLFELLKILSNVASAMEDCHYENVEKAAQATKDHVERLMEVNE